MGSDSTSLVTCAFCCIFQSTLPGWGATATEINRLWPQLFQSTLPGWGATSSPLGVATTIARFQSTLPGWGATHRPELRGQSIEKISIHAPRMGSDFRLELYCCRRRISIHAPRMGSDRSWSFACPAIRLFQSTLPGWGATRALPCFALGSKFQSTLPGWGATVPHWSLAFSAGYFNPRSPDGERLHTGFPGCRYQKISIHAPRMGSDPIRRLPNRADTPISIHAPRMGSDLTLLYSFTVI